nr:hypothetical protein [Anoxybacter fermentans]
MDKAKTEDEEDERVEELGLSRGVQKDFDEEMKEFCQPINQYGIA